MNIFWYGQSCFKIQTKPKRGENEVTIFTDPFDKSIGLRPPKGQADVVTVSHSHHDHNNIEALKGQPFVVSSPGEYSLKSVVIEGIEAFHDKNQGKERGRNTIFVLESEDLRICHLGDLGHTLSEKQVDEIGQIDVLMIPVGGKYTLNAKEAEEVIGQLEPKIIIPMHYKVLGSTLTELDPVDEFTREFGVEKGETISKLSLKKSEIEDWENKVIIMKISNS